MSRWSYPTAVVECEGNKQTVRCLTAGERSQYVGLGRAIRENTAKPTDIPIAIVGWGAINPPLQPEDVLEMPTALLDACVMKILELSGMGKDDDEDEKKEPAPVSPPANSIDVESPTS